MSHKLAAQPNGSRRRSSGGGSGPSHAALPSQDAYGKFIGISTFFNPGRHENKVENFRKFKGAVAAQGLQMLCVELVFGDSTFQLLDASSDAPDCEIMVQRRTSEGNTLWQKERLLNIALDNLPASVTKVMWLDSDLIFLNDDRPTDAVEERMYHITTLTPAGTHIPGTE